MVGCTLGCAPPPTLVDVVVTLAPPTEVIWTAEALVSVVMPAPEPLAAGSSRAGFPGAAASKLPASSFTRGSLWVRRDGSEVALFRHVGQVANVPALSDAVRRGRWERPNQRVRRTRENAIFRCNRDGPPAKQW
jgi:hypothetical protein